MELKQIKGYSNYYISEFGDVFKKNKHNKLRSVSVSKEKNCGFYRVNIESDDGKWGTLLLHRLVYRTFKGDYEGDLVFLDGNKENCELSNLITVKELLEFYKENINKW